MAIFADTVVLNSTGPTAIVAPASTAYPNQSISRGIRWRTAVLNCTGSVWLGGNATGVTGTGATGTMALVSAFPITLPLGPDEGIYGTVNSGNSTISVVVSGA